MDTKPAMTKPPSAAAETPICAHGKAAWERCDQCEAGMHGNGNSGFTAETPAGSETLAAELAQLVARINAVGDDDDAEELEICQAARNFVFENSEELLLALERADELDSAQSAYVDMRDQLTAAQNARDEGIDFWTAEAAKLKLSLAAAQKERDEAIAYGRQPYPTAWAALASRPAKGGQ